MTAAVALGALAAPGAAAHVTVQPTTSRPAELQRYRVIVPNEDDRSATTGVDIKVPAGVTFMLVESVAGWRSQVVRRGGAIAELRWKAGRIPPDGYSELHFIARNPVKVGPIEWKALQRYDNGRIARWIGAKDSDQPAPITTLSEDAVPVDAVSTNGEPLPTAASASTPPASKPVVAAESGRDVLTLALAIVATVLAAAALGLTLVRRGARE